MSEKNVRYSREFKLDALQRMETCGNVSALARELGIRRKHLYAWRERLGKGGELALLNGPGRPPGAKKAEQPKRVVGPPKDLEKRVVELQRLLGAKQMEVDFFKRTFEHVREAMQNPGENGGKTSIKGSKQDFRSKDRS